MVVHIYHTYVSYKEPHVCLTIHTDDPKTIPKQLQHFIDNCIKRRRRIQQVNTLF